MKRTLRAEYSGVQPERELERSKVIHIDGYLNFDGRDKTATVTITALARPFENDLSQKLR